MQCCTICYSKCTAHAFQFDCSRFFKRCPFKSVGSPLDFKETLYIKCLHMFFFRTTFNLKFCQNFIAQAINSFYKNNHLNPNYYQFLLYFLFLKFAITDEIVKRFPVLIYFFFITM